MRLHVENVTGLYQHLLVFLVLQKLNVARICLLKTVGDSGLVNRFRLQIKAVVLDYRAQLNLQLVLVVRVHQLLYDLQVPVCLFLRKLVRVQQLVAISSPV